MDKNDITKEYNKHLESLKSINLYVFIKDIENFKRNNENYFKLIESYINKVIPIEVLNILKKEEFIKLFYLDSQAKYIKEKLKLNNPIDILKTIVYCYNHNSREFNKKREEEKLKEELTDRGFKEQDILNEEELKKLNDLKVFCVFDRDKIGILGSFTKKEEHEGKLIYTERGLFFLPKRHTKTGQSLTSKFYYKEKPKSI